MTFVNNLSPWAIHFVVSGHEFGVRWYGLAYATGFLLGYAAFRAAIRRGDLPNATAHTLERLLTAEVVGVLAGGRIGYVIQNLGEWKSDPLFPFKVYQGGMAFFGGLLGVILGMIWVARKDKLKMWSLTDVAAIPTMAALGLGRLANFANAELWGRPTHSSWGVIYPHVDNQLRHPSELYEATSHFLGYFILVAIFKLNPTWIKDRSGIISALFLILYGLFRFITDFWREEPLIGSLNSGQIASLVVLAFGGVFLAMNARPKSKNLAEVPASI